MEQQIIFTDAFTKLDNFGLCAVQPNSLVSILPENQWLAIFDFNDGICFGFAIGGIVPRAIVKYVAVLIDLDERSSFVLGSTAQYFTQVLDVNIDRACDEACLATNGNR